MTAQFSERLRLDNADVSLCTMPLDDYFTLTGNKPQLAVTSTALRRGYVGRWEITGDRLYLIGIDAELSNGEPLCLEMLFLGFPDRVFAHWYTGTLRIPKGKQLKYVHGGFGSTYEYDLFIDIDQGVVTGKRLQQNGTASRDAPDGYQVAALTRFLRVDRGDKS